MANAHQMRWNFVPGDTGWLSAGRWLWARATTWAIVLFAVALAFFVAAVRGPSWLGLAGTWSYVAAATLPPLAFIAYTYLVKWVEHRQAQEVAPHGSMWRDLVAGCASGIALVTCMWLLLCALGLYQVHLGQWSGWFDSFLFNSFISGMLEELAFRAILLRLLARAFGPVAGLVLSSIMFGLAHLSHATLLAAAEIAFNGGLILGLLYMVSGRLWSSVGLHIGWDFAEDSLLGVNSAHGLLQSSPTTSQPSYLTGGPYGPDASMLAMIIGALCIVAILVAQRKGYFHASKPFQGELRQVR